MPDPPSLESQEGEREAEIRESAVMSWGGSFKLAASDVDYLLNALESVRRELTTTQEALRRAEAGD